MFPPGTLLLPNAYQFQRGDPIFGMIINAKPTKWGPEYTVILSNGNTAIRQTERWVYDLFEPVQIDDNLDGMGS